MAEYIENVAAQASKLDWAFPFERKGQFPLDRSALFSSLDDARLYASGEATDARKLGGTSYVGQIITVYQAESDDGTPASVNAYIITPSRELMKLAATTASGDLSADLLALKQRVYTLEVGMTQTQEKIQGINTNIGARKDDETDTEASGLWGAVEALEGRATALEGKEDKDTTYSVAEGDKVLKLTGTEFSTELGLKHENGKISLTGIDGEVIAEFSDADFIADGVLEDVSYNAETKELTFTWNVLGEDGQKKTDVVNISDLIDTYTAGNGIDITNAVVSAKVKTDEKYLKVGANGLYTEGIDEAIAKAIEELPKEDNDTTYTLTGDGITVTLTPSEGETNSVTLDVYTKSETDNKIDEKIASVTGGESAADVKLALESYRDALNKEVWGDAAGEWTTSVTEDGKTKVTYNPKYGEESRIDKLEKVGAQANVIEEIQVNNSPVAINDKKVNITVPTALSQLTDDKNYLTNVKVKDSTADGEGNVTYEAWLKVEQSTADVRVIDDSRVQSEVKAAKDRADAAYTLAEGAGEAAATAQGGANAAYGLAEQAKERADEAYTLADGALTGVKIGETEFTVENKIALIDAANGRAALGLGTAAEKNVNDFLDALTYGPKITNLETGLGVTIERLDNVYKPGENDETPATGILPELIANVNKLAEDIGNVSNVMNFRGVVDKTDAGFEKDIEAITDAAEGDVIIYGEQEYVYSGGIWVLFGDASGNAAAITALTERIDAIPGVIDEKIAAIPAAEQSLLGLIKGTENKLIIAKGEITGVSTDLLFQGEEELVLNGGKA